MGDKIYRVVLDLSTSGSLDTKTKTAADNAGKLEGSFAKVREQVIGIGAGLADAFTGAVEKVGAMALSVGALAGAAGIGAVIYGVTHLNNELESTKISLAAIFGANGQTNSFAEGMDLAGETMAKIRQDAKALPGETEDLIRIFRSISIPSFQAGKDIGGIESMSAKFMAFGAVAGMQQETVAREAAMLLEGRAGAHNMLGLRLAGLGGDAAKSFNQKSAAERFDFLSKELNKYGDSIAYYSHSFDGLSSTLKDNAKNFLRMATEPLFGRIKDALEGVNGWFDANQTRVERWAQLIGDKLAAAFDFAIDTIKEWAPAIESFANAAWKDLSDLWDRLGPSIAEAANALKTALADGTALSKIEDILKLYAITKIGMPALSGVGGAAKLGGGIMEGFGAGGASLGLAGGAVAAPLAISLALAAAAAVGFSAALADSQSEYHERATAVVSRFSTEWDRLSEQLNVNVMPTLEHFGVMVGESIVGNLELFNNALEWTTHPLNSLAISFDYLANLIGEGSPVATALQAWADGLDANRRLNRNEDQLQQELDQDIRGRRDGDFSMPGRGTAWGQAIADPIKAALKPGLGPGAGGTHVQKVEIVVSSNQDPGRIAELVIDKIENINRHPRIASRAPNFRRTP